MQQNMNKSAMINGLIFGAMLSLKFLLSSFNNSTLSIIGFFISVSIVFALYKFATNYRDKVNEGFIKYSQAFVYIFQMYLYGSVVMSLVVLIYTSLNHDFLSSMLNQILTMYDKFNIPIEDEVTSLFESIYKPAPFALFNLFSSTIGAAFWGLILAAFVKKEKSIFE